MMRYIGFEREEEAEQWARRKMDLSHAPEFFRAMSAVDENEQFVCVVVLTNFTSRNIDLNIAVDKEKVTPKSSVDMFNSVCGYLFDELKIARVTGLVRGKNVVCRRFVERFGFKLEGVMRKSFQDDDLYVYGFLSEEYHAHKWCRS